MVELPKCKGAHKTVCPVTERVENGNGKVKDLQFWENHIVFEGTVQDDSLASERRPSVQKSIIKLF